jgi:hypothetical protein
MSDAVGQLLAGVLSDDTFKKRLVALTEETEQAEAAREALRLATEANQQILAEIQRGQRAIDKEKEDLKTQQDAVAAEKAMLTTMLSNHNAERTRWEAARKMTDGEHADRAARLADAEKAQDAVAVRQGAKETELLERERVIAGREAAHAEAARHARAFSEAVAA